MKNDLERYSERQNKRQTVTQKLSRKNPETAIARMTEIGKINNRRLSPKMKQSPRQRDRERKAPHQKKKMIKKTQKEPQKAIKMERRKKK